MCGDGVPPAALEQATELIRGRGTASSSSSGARVFAEVYGPPPRLVIIGAVDTAEALCQRGEAARLARRSSPTRAPSSRRRERIPSADELDRRVAGGGARAGAARPRDRGRRPHARRRSSTIPALKAALATDAFYIGALGSRRNQERRRETAARGGRRRGGARADLRPVRPRHRRRLASPRPPCRSSPRSSLSAPGARAGGSATASGASTPKRSDDASRRARPW